ncbi:MAG: hypothetical protein K940chlam7_01783 [Chlamydiae bacterium]|nr:hypothetical protein [Chlamydiota bacterium]
MFAGFPLLTNIAQTLAGYTLPFLHCQNIIPTLYGVSISSPLLKLVKFYRKDGPIMSEVQILTQALFAFFFSTTNFFDFAA